MVVHYYLLRLVVVVVMVAVVVVVVVVVVVAVSYISYSLQKEFEETGRRTDRDSETARRKFGRGSGQRERAR